MTTSLYASGTQLALIGTEHLLTNVADPGVYTFHVDKINMVAGDVLELRAYQTILTGGTARVVQYVYNIGAQPPDDMITVFNPLPNDLTDVVSLKYTLKQPNGTGRNFAWKVVQNELSPTALLAALIEGTETLQQTLRLIRSATLGKSDGNVPVTPGTLHFRDKADTKNRITATVDGLGNRSAIVSDGT